MIRTRAKSHKLAGFSILNILDELLNMRQANFCRMRLIITHHMANPIEIVAIAMDC